MNWEVFEKALINYNKLEVNKILLHFLAEKNGIDFIDEYIVKSLTSIGDKWEKGEVALSQVYMSSRLCEEIATSILSDKYRIFLNIHNNISDGRELVLINICIIISY